jgi:hypothetical protein
MRPRRKQAGGSLDSLLDTMTNVVGILVILLVVTQLGVRGAVERISVSDAVDPEALAQMQRKADEAERLRSELEQRLAAYQNRNPRLLPAQLQRTLRQISNVQADLDGVLQTRRLAEAKAREGLEEIQQQLEEQRKKEAELKKQIASALDEVAKLEARLEKTPAREAPAAKIVHLPNPRAAPEGAQPVTFYCRRGRIALLDLPASQHRAVKWTQFNIARRRLGDPAKGVECGKLFSDFNREEFRDKNFLLKLEARGRYPYIVFVERENFGESTDEMLAAGSDYGKQIATIDPRRFYVRYLVWSDSFETYIAARRLATEEGLLAGWELQTRPDEYRVRLESNLRCGPPPPPKPKPPPKPGEKPPPKPPQPPRKFPDDVID